METNYLSDQFTNIDLGNSYNSTEVDWLVLGCGFVEGQGPSNDAPSQEVMDACPKEQLLIIH